MHRVVVITGASTGLGLALTEKFLKAGDRVYGISKTSRHWPPARKRLGKNSRFSLLQGDVSREATVRRLVSKIHRQTRHIDILINNAGYANRPLRTEKEVLGEFQKHFSSNFVTAFLMAKYTLPIFLKQKTGLIINIASMAGKRAVPRLAAYSASKFAVLALSQCLAKENPGPGFRCITVCPGGINTKMRAKVFGEEDARKQQSPEFVADKIFEAVEGRIEVPSGGDILIRHGRVTGVNPPPEA